MKKIACLVATALVTLLVACQQQASAPAPAPYPGPPPPGGVAPCQPGPPTCSGDRRAVVSACGNAFTFLQSCLGPAGCAMGPQGIVCDESIAQPNAPCRAEGTYGCSPDLGAMIQCRGGRQVVASTCKGSRRCAVGNAIACDSSIADPGDPCDSEGKSACARDGRVLLRCSRGVFATAQTCSQMACMSAGGRILCQ